MPHNLMWLCRVRLEWWSWSLVVHARKLTWLLQWDRLTRVSCSEGIPSRGGACQQSTICFFDKAEPSLLGWKGAYLVTGEEVGHLILQLYRCGGTSLGCFLVVLFEMGFYVALAVLNAVDSGLELRSASWVLGLKTSCHHTWWWSFLNGGKLLWIPVGIGCEMCWSSWFDLSNELNWVDVFAI